ERVGGAGDACGRAVRGGQGAPRARPGGHAPRAGAAPPPAQHLHLPAHPVGGLLDAARGDRDPQPLRARRPRVGHGRALRGRGAALLPAVVGRAPALVRARARGRPGARLHVDRRRDLDRRHLRLGGAPELALLLRALPRERPEPAQLPPRGLVRPRHPAELPAHALLGGVRGPPAAPLADGARETVPALHVGDLPAPHRLEREAAARADDGRDGARPVVDRRAARQVAAARGGEGAGGGGQRRQEQLPGEHEPRAAHAAQRDHRLQRDAHRGSRGHGRRRRARPRPRAHPRLRQAPPRPRQRRARPLQDRGRADGAAHRRLLGRRPPARGGGHGGAARPARRQPPRARRRRLARHGGRRRDADAADAAEPALERHQVLRARDDHARGEPRAGRGRPRRARARHRHRHDARAGREAVPPLHAGGRVVHAPPRRERARAHDHAAVRPDARRLHHRGERGGRRELLRAPPPHRARGAPRVGHRRRRARGRQGAAERRVRGPRTHRQRATRGGM
ncbi:MAG: hypothetical protein AVDCRST_MAG40-1498, partial [uncultured Gemmatimonadaceae bacterium]